MYRYSITIGLTLLLAITLIACGAEPASPPPPPTAAAGPTPTAQTASVLTDPAQATSEAVVIAPTFTPSLTPPPTSTNTPVPPTVTPVPTDTPEPVSMIKVDDTLDTPVNVRTGPGVDYPVLDQFDPGQEAIVLGRNADNTWWQISLAETADADSVGWIFAGLTTLTGDDGGIPIAEAPPLPPTATPDPNAVAQAEAAPEAANDRPEEPTTPEELEEQLRCGKDFCVTYQAMVPIWENGGCIGNHSIYVTVLEGPPPGHPMDGVVLGDTFGNVEVASGDKGPGSAEFTLWMNAMSVKVKRNIDGTPYTSEESFPFTAHDEQIPAEVLAANGYCDGSVEKCRWAQQNNQVCRGHYSWKVTFHKFD